MSDQNIFDRCVEKMLGEARSCSSLGRVDASGRVDMHEDVARYLCRAVFRHLAAAMDKYEWNGDVEIEGVVMGVGDWLREAAK